MPTVLWNACRNFFKDVCGCVRYLLIVIVWASIGILPCIALWLYIGSDVANAKIIMIVWGCIIAIHVIGIPLYCFCIYYLQEKKKQKPKRVESHIIPTQNFPTQREFTGVAILPQMSNTLAVTTQFEEDPNELSPTN